MLASGAISSYIDDEVEVVEFERFLCSLDIVRDRSRVAGGEGKGFIEPLGDD